MKPEALRRLLGLKTVKRQGWTRFPIPEVESVADHSYGVALLAYLLCPKDLDRTRVLELALLHDLAEVVTGDITPYDGVPSEKKSRDETEALTALLLPLGRGPEELDLLRDYQQQRTPEACFVKALDKLEMSLQSQIYQTEYGHDLSEFRASARDVLSKAGLSSWVEDEAPEADRE